MPDENKKTASTETVTMSKADLENLMAQVATKAADDTAAKIVEADKAKTTGVHEAIIKIAERVPAQVKTPAQKGENATRIIRAFIGTGKQVHAMPKFLQDTYGPEGAEVADKVGKALAAGQGSAGGYMVPPEYSAELIDLLRPLSVVRRAGATTMPLNGLMNIPKQTGTVQGTYIGENQTITKSEPTFGNLTLSEKKLAVLVPVSNDLIRLATPSADSVLRNDIVRSLGVTEDQTFLRSDGAGAAPRGLLYWANSSNKFNANVTVNLANVTADLGTLERKLMDNNVDLANAAYIMAPRTANFLRNLRDSNGVKAFPEMDIAMSQGGMTNKTGPNAMLRGFPVYITNNVPINISGSNSEIYFVNMADVIIGEAESLILDTSSEATYIDAGSPVSAFANDQTVIRAIARHDLVTRYDLSVAVMQAVTWA